MPEGKIYRKNHPNKKRQSLIYPYPKDVLGTGLSMN